MVPRETAIGGAIPEPRRAFISRGAGGAAVFHPIELIPAGLGYNVQTLQFLITVIVAAFDIVVVWWGVWIPMRREVDPQDRKYIWRGLADYARASRLEAETNSRIRRQRAEQQAQEAERAGR